MSGVPYTFANATTTIALSNLDANFNTPVTIGNTTVGLGNTVTTLGNVTLTNATISLNGGSANGVVYINSSNVATANASVISVLPNGQFFIGGASNPNNSVAGSINGISLSGGQGIFTIYNTDQTTSSDPAPALVIFKGSSTTNSNQRFIQFYTVGGGAMGGIVGNGATNAQFLSLSDEREKTNITPVTGALSRVIQLQVSSFDRIGSNEHVKAGFIAQNVLTIYPEYVVENASNDGQEQRYGVTGGMSAGFVAELTAALQELSAQVTTLQSQVAALQAKVGV